MNQQVTEVEESVATQTVSAKRHWFWGIWKWILGAVSCQGPVFALNGAGWAYRLAERSAMKAWWKGQSAPGDRFREAARVTPFLAAYERTPNWIWAQDRAAHGMLMRWVNGLLKNLWLGFCAWFHSLVFLVVPSILMMVSWYSGWDNSFNKGYEQFAVGQQLGLIGVFLMVVVMFYLPMAQARFAMTQDVRSFYDFRLNRQLIRTQWIACLGLVAGYAISGLPLMAADSLLGLITGEKSSQEPNALSELTAAQALGFLQTYFFWWGFYVFGAFVALRCWAARIYARGVQRATQQGRLNAETLSEKERQAIDHFQMASRPPVVRGRVRALGSNVTRIFIGAVAAVLLWLGFGFQTHVKQFFNYQHELRRWSNQPLVQIPWFHHIPAHLKEGKLEPDWD